MLAFPLQWPTLVTLIMFPVPVVMNVRLAIAEEAYARKELGATCDDYATRTPRFLKRLVTRAKGARS